MNCLIDTKTSGGKANYMMIRLYPGHELLHFRELATQKWEQMTPGTEDSVSSVQSLSHVRLFET